MRKMHVGFLIISSFASLILSPHSSVAAGKAPQLSNVNIVYAETRPNDEEAGSPRGRLKAIYKEFDSVKDVKSKTTNAKADKVAMQHGYLEVPEPMISAVINKLAMYNVKASPTFHSSLRTKEQLEKLRGEIAEKFPALSGKPDFVITLLPYQTVFSSDDSVVVWFGIGFYDLTDRSNNAMLNYIHVPFGKMSNGFTDEDGDRFAAVLVNDLVKRGYLTKQSN